ncbi:hypothetical protein OIU77_025755 [Salix suchowensis]|uniref:Uncharacterized protein n=1 Tax=Salix suchowensis TaxID=1278906 RepID=A0ABQ9BY47_9ROSI|nr:hypothetical protein OIU78_012467 [Salix suchowensis]KAJ6391854.1 hypothetical protein OIU77_025755 [Salix suchowensis]
MRHATLYGRPIGLDEKIKIDLIVTKTAGFYLRFLVNLEAICQEKRLKILPVDRVKVFACLACFRLKFSVQNERWSKSLHLQPYG